MADGDRTVGHIQSINGRPGSKGGDVRQWIPELRVIVGRDSESSGIAVTAWEDSGGQHPRLVVLFEARWAARIDSTEEALRIALRGVSAALVELVGPED